MHRVGVTLCRKKRPWTKPSILSDEPRDFTLWPLEQGEVAAVTPEEKLERERERERLKKARQRQGYSVLPIEVHLPSLIGMLIAEGLLADKDIEDRDAIAEAAAAHFRNHHQLGRILEDRKTTPTLPSKRELWRLPAPWHGADPKRLRSMEESGAPSMAIPDTSKLPHWDRRGKGGRNGRNPGMLTGATGGTPCPGSRQNKKIKQLKPSQLRKLEESFGNLNDRDSSPHFVATYDGEVEQKLDQREWEELGDAKRRPAIRQFYGNEPE